MAEMELPDIAATMGAAYDAAESGTEYVQPVREEPEPVEAEAPEGEEAAATDTDQPGEEAAEPADDSTQPLDPHPRWTAEQKELFAKLPREAQEFVLARQHDSEKAVTQRTQELSQQSTRYKALDELLEPRRQAFAMDGYDDVGAVRQLFALSDFAAKDPASFINWFAQQRGVDLASLNNAPGDDSGDPEITALRKELAQIKGTLTQSQEQQTRAQQQQLQAQVQEFASETDDKGQPLRPHFEAVKGHMGALLQSGTAKDLSDAYEQAVWANPETRKALMESQSKAEQEKRTAEAKAKAAAAQKAASTKPRASNGQFVPAPDSSIADTMSKVYDSMHGAS